MDTADKIMPENLSNDKNDAYYEGMHVMWDRLSPACKYAKWNTKKCTDPNRHIVCNMGFETDVANKKRCGFENCLASGDIVRHKQYVESTKYQALYDECLHNLMQANKLAKELHELKKDIATEIGG